MENLFRNTTCNVFSYNCGESNLLVLITSLIENELLHNYRYDG